MNVYSQKDNSSNKQVHIVWIAFSHMDSGFYCVQCELKNVHDSSMCLINQTKAFTAKILKALLEIHPLDKHFSIVNTGSEP